MALNRSRPPKEHAHGQHAQGTHEHAPQVHRKHVHATHQRQGSLWSRITGGIPLHVRVTGGNLGSKQNRAAYFKSQFEGTINKINKERRFPLSREEISRLQVKAAEFRKKYEDIAGKQK